jgi:hypothetical protein
MTQQTFNNEVSQMLEELKVVAVWGKL